MAGIVPTLQSFALRVESDLEVVLAAILKAYEADYLPSEERGLSEFAYVFLVTASERRLTGADSDRLHEWLGCHGADACAAISVTTHFGDLPLGGGRILGEVAIRMGEGDRLSHLVIRGVRKAETLSLRIRIRFPQKHAGNGRHLRFLLEDWGGHDPFKLKRGKRKQELLPPTDILKLERPVLIVAGTDEMAG